MTGTPCISVRLWKHIKKCKSGRTHRQRCRANAQNAEIPLQDTARSYYMESGKASARSLPFLPPEPSPSPLCEKEADSENIPISFFHPILTAESLPERRFLSREGLYFRNTQLIAPGDAASWRRGRRRERDAALLRKSAILSHYKNLPNKSAPLYPAGCVSGVLRRFLVWRLSAFSQRQKR